MKKTFLSFLILFTMTAAYCQKEGTNSKLNLDFEIMEKGIPSGWATYGSSNYSISIDSTNTKSGKYCALIEFKEGTPDFKALGFALPHNYYGKKITLSGYIKTENVTDGFAGLCVRIDPSIAFENMKKNGIKSTTDWKKYEITLPMFPEKTKQIFIGAVLAGKGKIWLDDFKVTVDGKDIKGLKPFEGKFPAERDREFDKGSLITSIQMNEGKIKTLKELGLIWGFLKYHHPNIAKGEYNWDYELFRVLPQVINSETKMGRDEILVKWIEKFGTFSQGVENKIKSEGIKSVPDLDWIQHSNFSVELTSLLLKVKNAKRTKEHFYIGLYPEINAPDFKNENEYASMKYPDSGFRILTLFRYWNMIQYYFPYKYLIEEDWKSVLEEFIPKMINVRNETEYQLTVLELIGRINDTHATITSNNQGLNNFFGTKFIPVQLKFIENKPVVTGFSDEKFEKESGVKIGDVITAINNKPVEEIVNEKLKYASASNYPTKLRNISYYLLRTNDPTINFEIARNNQAEKKTFKTFLPNEITVKKQVTDTCFKFISKDIVYVNEGSLKRKYLPKIWKEIRDSKGLIIDLRNYPSDSPLYEFGDYLMPKKIPFVKFTEPSIENPGLFEYIKSTSIGRKNKDYYKGKVIILVNESTQSLAEFEAMGYRANPNATVIGSTTAGADGNSPPISLPGGIKTLISGLGVYYPDGKETQRVGIVPDIEIRPTIQGIKEGRDELMEKAIEIINKTI